MADSIKEKWILKLTSEGMTKEQAEIEWENNILPSLEMQMSKKKKNTDDGTMLDESQLIDE